MIVLLCAVRQHQALAFACNFYARPAHTHNEIHADIPALETKLEDVLRPPFELPKPELDFLKPRFELHNVKLDFLKPRFELHNVELDFLKPRFELHNVELGLRDTGQEEAGIGEKSDQQAGKIAHEMRHPRDRVKRVRTGVKSVFGDNASEYEVVGGTRMGDRKPRTLKKEDEVVA